MHGRWHRVYGIVAFGWLCAKRPSGPVSIKGVKPGEAGSEMWDVIAISAIFSTQ